MRDRETYIKNIQTLIINYNEFWEDPITESELVKNPMDVAKELMAYCNFLEAKLKNNKNSKNAKYTSFNSYYQYPIDIRMCIDQMVCLVSDDRPLREKHKYTNCSVCFDFEVKEDREYDHHVEKNGRLSFENKWYDKIDRILESCEKLIDVIQSEKETESLNQFVGKSFEYCHYESGSYVITIDKINKNNNEFTFDGKIVYYATVDSQFELDGILMEDVEDYKFTDLPYIEDEDVEDEESLVEFLKCGTEKTLLELANDLRTSIISYFEQTYGVECN